MMPGMGERRTCDYVRHSLTSLFAAFNIAYGTVISSIHSGPASSSVSSPAWQPRLRSSPRSRHPRLGHWMARRAQTLHLD